MSDIPILYNQSYGQRFWIDTWCDDVATASAVTFKWRREGSTTTYKITGSVVAVADLDKLEKRSVECTIPAGWLKDKLGLWIVQAFVRWGVSTAEVASDPVLVKVERTPSMTTTTTSTTSSTSSTTTTPA